MPAIQEFIALGIVALVAGRLALRLFWRRSATRGALSKPGGKSDSKSGACGDCASAGPPPTEAPVHFYRKRTGP